MVTDCIFCKMTIRNIHLVGNLRAFAVYDQHPVSPGHALVISRRHVDTYFELTPSETNDMWRLVKRLYLFIKTDGFDPHGVNIGVNVGRTAGQTVMHAHLHLIPRYMGDVKDPTGGVRNVVPGKGIY